MALPSWILFNDFFLLFSESSSSACLAFSWSCNSSIKSFFFCFALILIYIFGQRLVFIIVGRKLFVYTMCCLLRESSHCVCGRGWR